MNTEIWGKLLKNRLAMDQTGALLELERDQVEHYYLPLAEILISRSSPPGRLIVAIAGPPGSGKSAFAAILCTVLNARLDKESAVVVGLDGWHFPNAYLDSHYLERDGERVLLRTLKGSPETFDASSALKCLQAIRQGTEITYPIYSRLKHDPLPEAGKVLPSHHFVLVEGNYLLLENDPWGQFREIFDTTIFIKASLETCLAGLLERHRRTGKSEAAVKHQVEVVDLPNAHLVLASSQEAEFIIEKEDPRLIKHISWVATGQMW